MAGCGSWKDELMRVLHLDSGREMRGGQWQAVRLVEGLAAQGIEATLLAHRAMPNAQPLTLRRLVRLAREHDLVHAHDARSHTLAVLLCRRPVVVSRRVAFPVANGWKYRRAAHYIAVSAFVKSVLTGCGVPESKISVVPDGVPLLETAGPGEYVLAPANARDPRKGAALAMEAARRAGMELRLSYDLEADLRHAASFVYITYSEGLGSAILLAMSAGVPVVASKTGGIPEILRHGENGLLVDNTPDSIAAALAALAEDTALARRLGNAGRATVAAGFTVDHMVRRTMEVYRQVLS
jgi:hypothetical protein